MRTGGLGAFKENIGVWIGAGTHCVRRLHPETILPNTAKRAVNLAASSAEFWPAQHLFILREDLAADTKPNIRLKESEQENLRGRRGSAKMSLRRRRKPIAPPFRAGWATIVNSSAHGHGRFSLKYISEIEINL